MTLLDREYFRYLARHFVTSIMAGAFIGGISTGWNPAYVFKGAQIGIVFLIVFSVGRRCFRVWALPAPVSRNFEWEGFRFVGKLLLVWIAEMMVVLPIIHWVVGHRVLFNFNAILPLAACSLACVAVQLVADTAAKLFRMGAELARSQARAEFLVLKAQLQPHTLFNALNGIIGLIRQSPREAEEATRRLASLLRRILEGIDKTNWTLADEFGVVEDLLKLEMLRFGDRLKTNVVMDPSMASRQVPPLSVLPLVENSLRHGFRAKVGSCSLRVEAVDGNVIVEDNGMGFDATSQEGVGMRTVRERIEAEGGRLLFSEARPGAYVELQLP